MKITFCGAAGTVTGSCYLIETDQCRFLVDCGMFQGNRELRQLNRGEFRFNPTQIDFVLLTHAHVDHAGLLPKLWKSGYQGPIYATKATTELSNIILLDSAHIQEMETEWRQRKNQRSGAPVETTLYTIEDAAGCLSHFQPYSYNTQFEPQPGIVVNFRDAGHILGSAIIEVNINEQRKTSKLVFSGDLGQKDQPIIQDPSFIESADYVIIESTYGNRTHEAHIARIDALKDIILASIKTGGNLIIPSFAVGRTQDLLYHIKLLLKEELIPKVPVYIDSPMAVSVTETYRNNPECYDAPTRELLAAKESPFEFPNLHYIRTAEESKRLNSIAKGCIIISASGMCEAGRILHHLKHNLWRPESHILFVGYQAEGTLGRRLLEGAKVVKIMGEVVSVQAKIDTIEGFSAHADQPLLLEWLGHFKVKPTGVFVTHGEQQAAQVLAGLIKERLGLETFIPSLGDHYDLTTRIISEAKVAPKNKAVLLGNKKYPTWNTWY